MRNFEPAKFDSRLEERMAIIVVLGRRRDQILLSSFLDLKALEELVADYEFADMPCAAASLRKRLEWYRARLGGEEGVDKTVVGQQSRAALVSRLA